MPYSELAGEGLEKLRRFLCLAFLIAVCVLLLAGLIPILAMAQGIAAETSKAEGAQNLEELGKQLNNPISSVWNITTQSNWDFLKGDLSPAYRTQFVFNFQPVLPIPLTKDWTLIPEHAGHRGAGGDEHLFPPVQGVLGGGKHHRHHS
jgi:hypothetical protein